MVTSVASPRSVFNVQVEEEIQGLIGLRDVDVDGLDHQGALQLEGDSGCAFAQGDWFRHRADPRESVGDVHRRAAVEGDERLPLPIDQLNNGIQKIEQTKAPTESNPETLIPVSTS